MAKKLNKIWQMYVTLRWWGGMRYVVFQSAIYNYGDILRVLATYRQKRAHQDIQCGGHVSLY